MRLNRVSVLAGVSVLALAAPAYGQEAAADADEIIVTGTLVRGKAPTGTAVIGVDQKDIQASGATTITQLMQTVPQFASFNTIQAPVGGGNTVTTNRPNLRNLAASNTNGAAFTLMLVDGHRLVGMGILQTSPDLDTIAPGAIERVDIVPDGGSSIYGADAVGGVINFITRKTYDGIGVDGRVGFANNYTSWDANAIAGKTWSGGGAYLTYNYSQHGAIFGRDRDWVKQYPTASASFAIPVIGVNCLSPNVQVQGSSNIYGLPLTPNAAAKLNQPNQCDLSDYASVYPEERRHALFGAITQEIGDSATIELKGFFMDRQQSSISGFFNTNKTITPAGALQSPFRAANIVNAANETQIVRFGWGPEDASRQDVHIQAWGLTPTANVDLAEKLHARLTVNYGESLTTVHSPAFNDTALNAAINAGLFNPYNPSASNAGALAAIGNWETFGQAKQTQLQASLVFDGELFELPGGPIKFAMGGEYLRETFRAQKGNTVPGGQNNAVTALVVNGVTLPLSTTAGLAGGVAAIPVFSTSRDVLSAFGELVLPLLADAPGFKELTFSASGRIDSYSDFGNTFNPKLGVTWKPLDQVRIRAQWGKSFSAPSLANSADADPATATWSSGTVFNIFVPASSFSTLASLGYAAPTGSNSNILTLGGGSNFLRPQTAQTWSVGADIDPFPGARLSATYWNAKINDQIASPVGTASSNPSRYFQDFRSSYIISPTAGDIAGLLSQALIVNGSPCTPQPSCLYLVEFNSTQNLGKFHTSGLDFVVSYRTNTGFGSIDFVSAGSYVLARESSVSATAALVDQLPLGQSRLRFRTTLGADVGRLRGQITWNHTQGYDFTPVNPALAGFYPEQGHIDSFNTVDLFFKYDFDGEGAMKDLAVTLGINNLLDADPPVRYVGGSVPSQWGYANGSTIGRLVQLGLSARF
jgi:iron complex outermembrane recepter protein